MTHKIFGTSRAIEGPEKIREQKRAVFLSSNENIGATACIDADSSRVREEDPITL